MRKPRILSDNASYHVTSRSVHQRLLMDPPAVKEMFLQVIQRAKSLFDFQIDNFVIMGNHFHLIIKPAVGVSLSDIMKWILQVFASWYNRAHNLTGHFWGSRFFSWIIPNIWEYLRVFAYIDTNPVRANLVAQPCDWPFGGLAHRRRGHHSLVAPLPSWLRPIFPSHAR